MKVKVGFDDYEERDGSGYDGDEPKKGVYEGRLVSFDEHTSANGNEGFQWVFEITEEPYAGWRGWVYSNTDAAMWKTQQIVKAIQGGKEKPVTLDTDKGDVLVKKATPVRLRIARETYEGEPKGRIRTVLAPEESGGKKSKGRDPWDDDDDDDDDEDDD